MRREKQLNTESFRAVGQWTSFVCVFLVVFVSLSDKYIFERWRLRKEKREQTKQLEQQRKHTYGYDMQTDIELGHMLSVSRSVCRTLNDGGLLSTAEGNRIIFYKSVATPPDHVHGRQATRSLAHENSSG